MSFFVAGAVHGDVLASLFMTGAVLGEVLVSLFVAGAVLGDGQVHFSWQVQYLVKF